MQQYPVCIGTPDKDGKTLFVNYQFPTPEAAWQFIHACHEAYGRLCASGTRRSAIINPIPKKEFKCLNRRSKCN